MFTYPKVFAHETIDDRIHQRMCHRQPMGKEVATNIGVVAKFSFLILKVVLKVDQQLE